MTALFDQLLAEIDACRVCIDAPRRKPLPHDPRPVVRATPTARIAVFGQAPGTRVHASGKPFTDPSGDRLRDWMSVDTKTFYDASRIAIVPMGFCFPGLDRKGGDLPPRSECALVWRTRLLDQLTRVQLVLLVGSYAAKWHLGALAKANLTETVANWQSYAAVPIAPSGGITVRAIPIPHPSWRNNTWIKKNPWFETDLLPDLRASIAQELENS